MTNNGESSRFESRALYILRDFTLNVCSNEITSRFLRYDPKRVFEKYALDTRLLPDKLPLQRSQIQVDIDYLYLFGSSKVVDHLDPPLALRLVLYGAKPMALISGPENLMVSLRQWAIARGLQGILSPYKYLPVSDKYKGGYVNLTREGIFEGDRTEIYRSLLISRDEDRLICGWLSLYFGWHRFLGLLLGYPDCCTQVFEKNWDRAVSAHNGDPTWITLENSRFPPFDWRLNVIARYFSFQIIDHFPCHFRCKESVMIAQKYMSFLNAYEPEYASSLKVTLSHPILYTENNGVFIFPEARVIQSGDYQYLHYNPQSVIMTSFTQLSRSITCSSHIVSWAGKPEFYVAKQTYAGFLCWFGDLKS